MDGNIFDSTCEALVNPVNTEGICGKGLALDFAHKFVPNYRIYQRACDLKRLTVCKVLPTGPYITHPKWIINFPTKKKWRTPSELKWIIGGLLDLKDTINQLNIKSIAIPAIGCGLGGLSWIDVKRTIKDILEEIQDLDIELYGPK
jgi:O-acetyl-ADP-ribose deacetylase (regulator of RNase III)